MSVTIDKFKRALQYLKENNIHLKVNTQTGWTTNYLNIIGFITAGEDHLHHDIRGIVLSNMTETEGVLINNISTITAFELEKNCLEFEAKKVYFLNQEIHFKALILN